MKIYLIEELNTDTSISWWNENRKRINKVIKRFNDWQTETKFDKFEKEVVLAMIKACRKYGEGNSFSDWQFDILNDMENFIK